MEVFTIPHTGQGQGSRPFPPDRIRINFRDARVRRMFSRAEFAGKAQTVVPIRGIDEEGNVDLYQQGDEVPYSRSATPGVAQQIAATIGVFHRLGWGDITNPVYSVAMAYHSFLVVFDFDTASTYASLSTTQDERVNARLEHYLRGNYWYCRVRLCDWDPSQNKWIDCKPAEAYSRAYHAISTLFVEREEMYTGPGAVYAAKIVAYPEVSGADYAKRLFGSQRYTAYVGPSSPHYHEIIGAARRANSAAIRFAADLMRKGMGPLTIDGRPSVPAQLGKIRFGMGEIKLSDTLPAAVKASGDSIRAVGDNSAYASEWEELMSTYNTKEESAARAKQIIKEMLVRGYTPKTVARAQTESYE